jgi:hypothetical protein
VGCCDSSPNRHARRPAYDESHAIARSFEPGEDWRWCYVDERFGLTHPHAVRIAAVRELRKAWDWISGVR